MCQPKLRTLGPPLSKWAPAQSAVRAKRGRIRGLVTLTISGHRKAKKPISIPDLRVDFCGMPATFSV